MCMCVCLLFEVCFEGENSLVGGMRFKPEGSARLSTLVRFDRKAR